MGCNASATKAVVANPRNVKGDMQTDVTKQEKAAKTIVVEKFEDPIIETESKSDEEQEEDNVDEVATSAEEINIHVNASNSASSSAGETTNETSSPPSENNKQTDESLPSTNQTMNERSRALSAANEEAKKNQANEAHQVPDKSIRRKMTILAAKARTRFRAKSTENGKRKGEGGENKDSDESDDEGQKETEEEEVDHLVKWTSLTHSSTNVIPSAADIGNGCTGFAGDIESLSLAYSVVSRPGNDPQKRQKENQDSYALVPHFAGNPEAVFVGVFDGHGPNGAHASAFVKEAIPQFLVEHNIQDLEEPHLVRDLIHESCVRVNEALAESDIDVFLSGSTGIFAYMKEKCLFIANVGDSRAVLGKEVDSQAMQEVLVEAREMVVQDRKNKKENMYRPSLDPTFYEETPRQYVRVHLSDDHKPENPLEKERIIQNGGRVFEWGCMRVWRMEEDIPGLAMSRSFGDLCAQAVGVFAEPDVVCLKIDRGDSFLIFASDGVWDMVPSQEVVDVVGTYYTQFLEIEKAKKEDQKRTEQLESKSTVVVPGRERARTYTTSDGKSLTECHHAAIECVKTSAKRWKSSEDIVDDTTIAILFLKHPQLNTTIDIGG